MKHLLHPEFAIHADTLLEIISTASATSPEPEALAELIKEDADWLASWTWAMNIVSNNRVVGLSGCAYGVPFLNEQAADALVGLAVKMGDKVGFTPNEEEEKPYQIPEIVIGHFSEDCHAKVRDLIKYLNIWFALIYGNTPRSISSIQFTKYEPSDTAGGNWHFDEESDFTAVVSLAPELYQGGGTDIKITPTDYHHIPGLYKGFALVFNGKMMAHRGAKVDSGVRHLLTYWLSSSVDTGCEQIE